MFLQPIAAIGKMISRHGLKVVAVSKQGHAMTLKTALLQNIESAHFRGTLHSLESCHFNAPRLQPGERLWSSFHCRICQISPQRNSKYQANEFDQTFSWFAFRISIQERKQDQKNDSQRWKKKCSNDFPLSFKVTKRLEQKKEFPFRTRHE